jgi:hypothetical protein
LVKKDLNGLVGFAAANFMMFFASKPWKLRRGCACE